jgi:selenide,water dikinase
MKQKPLMLLSAAGGCSAKVGPLELNCILQNLQVDVSATIDGQFKCLDAGRIEFGEEFDIVQSIDAITPVSNDAYTYGAIAVEHALSDIYAVGATPFSGLFMLGLPALVVAHKTANEILQGGVNRLVKSGARLLKGHTMGAKELYFGVAVTGKLPSSPPITNFRCRENDALILTKPLGSGIIVTALKLSLSEVPIQGLSSEVIKRCEEVMLLSNSKASEVMVQLGVHACTDVTGFGLIGHLFNMLNSSGLSAILNFGSIPLIPGVLDLAKQDTVPRGSEANAAYWWKQCAFDDSLSYYQKIVLFDAQTSGGLLISVDAEKAERFLKALKNSGVSRSNIIGYVKRQDSDVVITVEQ